LPRRFLRNPRGVMAFDIDYDPARYRARGRDLFAGLAVYLVLLLGAASL